MKKNSPMSFEQIMIQQSYQSVEQPVYCRFCGMNVKTPSSNSPGGNNGAWRRNLDWEIKNHCHVKCASENQGGR
ncbi:putative replication protein [Paenibacillus sp. TCA20]|uniref:Restriction endonuclease n=1 Tax=Paenibacillus urinalis TaxID=521520 RepID=A0ABY7XH86_9BACL|nr:MULTISPECIES: hypothetical protein [Paenibacillus]WDI05079.1 hypothetical protein PUW25_26275 [Paenibacillus urinalis]GAK42095.1 putative replication protein [Paenibacillus sp. TCA20]